MTDPLALKGWYCIGSQSHYYKGNKYGVVGNGKCSTSPTKRKEQTEKVQPYLHLQQYISSLPGPQAQPKGDTEVPSQVEAESTRQARVAAYSGVREPSRRPG